MQFGGDVANVLLDVPDGFTGTPTASKKFDCIGVSLKIVAGHEAQQGCFARTVRTQEAQHLPRTHPDIHVPTHRLAPVPESELL